tara:strand:- start:105 stop:677 length:573 start_codon:yes stop_codon:yes gene_type:complete
MSTKQQKEKIMTAESTDSYYNPTEQTYISDIEDYAKEAMFHILDEMSDNDNFDSLDDLENWWFTEDYPHVHNDNVDLHDFIFNQADSSHYVFINWQAVKVVTEWSNNPDAYEENAIYVDNKGGNPLYKVAVQMAHYSMMADINDEIDNTLKLEHGVGKTIARLTVFRRWTQESKIGQEMKAAQDVHEFLR